MKLAMPCAEGKLAMHFGHCEQFVIVNTKNGSPEEMERTVVEPPPHEPGLLPKWLAGQGVNVVIAGGMGRRAKDLFGEQNIDVVVGAPAGTPEDLVRAFLTGGLKSGENVCDH